MTGKLLLIILTATFLLLTSCAKEGPQGIPGPQGDQGVAGPAGEDGSVIYSGAGAPAANMGQAGDYYLDRTTGNLYGPKTVSGWGSPILLGGQGGAGPQGPQGSPGAQGNPGSQILNGSGAPAATLGNNGDYYLDKTGYFLYGPKTANGWGTPVLLRGAQGPQGPAGPAGVAGSQIYSGTGAPAANLGNNGDYYLDKSTGKFYGPKTANGWGTPVDLGGAAGPQGPQGAQGAAGAAGAAGSQIYSGTTAPPAGTGKTGDYYIDDTHAVIYGPKTAAGWPATGLSLQVNNVITYDFADKPQFNLPYNWVGAHDGPSVFPGVTYIWLPYNNAGLQTQGFTIPQNIVDNGVVLSYIRYFLGPPSDTATSAGMTPWYELPYSLAYTDPYGGGTLANAHIATNVLSTGFGILLSQQNDGNVIDQYGEGFAYAHVPAMIRIVLIPAGQVNSIQSLHPSLQSRTSDELPEALIQGNNYLIHIK